MKRWMLAGVVLMLVAGLLFFGWRQVRQLLFIARADGELRHRLPDADSSLAYVIERQGTIEFTIPRGAPSLRVVTNATLPSALQVEPASIWPYVLRYEFLDSAGKLIVRRDYSCRASLRRFVDTERGESFSASFYLQSGLMPSDGHVVVFNLAEMPQAATMRVGIHSADATIRDVACRVYTEEAVPDFRLTHRWLRLSDAQKEKLAKGNVYSHDLLAESEIRNLLRGQENALGPNGVPGKSFSSRTLYVLRAYVGQEVVTPVAPAGVYVDRDMRGVIPLPEEGGKIRLSLLPVETGDAPQPGSPVVIRWFGRLISERKQVRVDWRAGGVSVVEDWKGGLLEVAVEGGAVVRAFCEQSGRPEREITPDPMYLRVFNVLPEHPLEYAVDRVGDAPTPFRLDIRHPIHAEGKKSEKLAQLTYRLLNRSGEVVGEGVLCSDRPPSVHDRSMNESLAMRISDPATYYFLLPSEVVTVRLSSDSPVLLAAYTRPLDLLREVRVPEDNFVAVDDAERQPSWFPLKPPGFQSLLTANRSPLILTQIRPPEDNQDMLAGRYQWRDFRPRGAAWSGRTLFVPVQKGWVEREEALPNTYQPLTVDKEARVDLRAPAGLRDIQPRLVYFRRVGEPFEVKMFLDGQPYYQGRAAGLSGEIALPMVQTGGHGIRLTASGTGEFFLSHTAPADGSIQKRFANLFEGGRLCFDYEHGAENGEILGIRLFAQQGQSARSVLRVWLDVPKGRPIGPLSSWSFVRRRFDIRPEEFGGGRVMAHRGRDTDQGQPFFIPLGLDLSPGRYSVCVELERGPGGYLLLSRIVPGVVSQRRVISEQGGRHVEMEN